MRDRRSTHRGLYLPATFRPQGLVTLSAAYALRARAGFVSHRQRSWDSPFGAFSSRKVPAAFPRGWTHMPFLPSVFPPPKRRAGPTGRGSWALTLAGVSGDRTRVSTPAAGCSHGLRPSRVLQRAAWSGLSPELLPRASATTDLAASRAGAPESRSALAWPHPARPASRTADGTTLRGFSHQYAPDRSSAAPARAMGSPLGALHIAANWPPIFGQVTSLYRSRSGVA
jgi:hypothetical protein